MTNEEAIEELREASDSEVRYGDTNNHYDEVMKRVEAFDMASKALEQKPTRPTGHWIAGVDRWGDIVTTVNGYRCSECCAFNADKDNFCPNCGARMTESEEEDVIADLKYCKESLDRIVKYAERNYKNSFSDSHHTVIQADIVKLRRDLNEVNHKLNWEYDRK